MLRAERAMVVAAHPDDEVLGPGGTVKRLTEQGTQVFTIIACQGRPTMEVTMRQAARGAQKMLGITDTIFLGLPNLGAEDQPLVEIAARLEDVFQQVRPGLVLTHHPGDLNQDHRVIFRATMVAARPLPGMPVQQILCFETPSSSEWNHPAVAQAFQPNLFADIESTLAAKLAALEPYQAEMRSYPHPRSRKGLTALACYRGMQAGMVQAEGFQLVRGIVT